MHRGAWSNGLRDIADGLMTEKSGQSLSRQEERAWQDSNLRHTAPETHCDRLQFDEKLISTRFLSHHLRTIS